MNIKNLLKKNPISIEITNITDRGWKSERDEIAGPGQKPTVPHPKPKIEEPIINSLSIYLDVGNSNFE